MLSAGTASRHATWGAAVLLGAGALHGMTAHALGTDAPRIAAHVQATWIEQETDSFHAPYAGPNSLSPGIGRETTDLTVYLGARLWPGAELWLDPEVDQGYGLNNTLGVAGFTSGEAYKVGSNSPYFRLPRAFVRDTFNLGGELARVEDGPNQFAQATSANRIVWTFGKFGVGDVFDTNRYAHDPRGDFLNWALVDAGSFDYAADAWGYTVGTALEWYQGAWTSRAGVFALSDIPNSTRLEPAGHEYQLDAELEHRHELWGAPGKLDVTVYESRGRMARLEDAILQGAATGAPPDPAAVRRFRRRDGISLNLEQQLTDSAGVFLRAGGSGGNVETYEFTDIDRSVSAGVSLNGRRWGRSEDVLGLGMAANQISRVRRAFLAAGGLGVLAGDGRLPHAAPEHILEFYYRAQLGKYVQLTADYQWVKNPAYNSDRGPVSVFAFRLHVQY